MKAVLKMVNETVPSSCQLHNMTEEFLSGLKQKVSNFLGN